MEGHINTYQGMNKDMAADTLPNSLYLDAVDIRITTSNGDSIGAWTNIKGNIEAFTIPISGSFNSNPWTAVNPEIIGYTTIRNRIVLFVADDSDSKGWIYDVQYDPTTREILPGFPVLKYYNPLLKFSKNHPIEALGRFESNCVQKVYWTDYENFLRSLNLEEDDLTTFPLGQIDIYPDVTFKQPIVNIITGGGNLTSGAYQIAYRLTTLDGKQTLISPPSNMIHIVANSENEIQSARYTGNPTPVNTGKSMSIEIDTSDYGDFEILEIISIYHSTIIATPDILSVQNVTIAQQSSITYIFTGGEQSSFPIELFEFTLKNLAVKTPKTITQKDSSLVISNIKSGQISIQDLLADNESFSALTKRYNTASTPTAPTLVDAFNEVYNKDAHWNADWHTNGQYKYKSNGTTLGGEGPNISYKFHLEPFTLDGSATAGFANVANVPFGFSYDSHDLQDGVGVYPNFTYPNNASPLISGLLRGYKRGETYRFGIIFYTNKGEASYVEYIGDIKFPDISDINDEDTINHSDFAGIKYFPISLDNAEFGTRTIGFSLGIQFTLDFSTCPSLLDQIQSYQIVRVRRTTKDRRRLAQGSIKGFWLNTITEAPNNSNFDLMVDGNSNVLHLYPAYPKITGDGFLLEGNNASFAMLEDFEGAGPVTPSGVEIYEDYLIKGQYLGFYTPEISYGQTDIIATASSLSNNPCLLITGAYNRLGAGTSETPQDLTNENLGEECTIVRQTIRSTLPISFHSIENIKKWKGVKYLSMKDSVSYNEAVAGPFSGYYLRNYYAIDDYTEASTSPGPDLNDPQGNLGSGTSNVPEISKAGTSIIGEVGKISIDFLTGAAITPAATDYFNPVNFVLKDRFLTVLPAAAKGACTPVVDLLIPRVEIYGGFSQFALETNIFIPASPVISKSALTPIVFGGDTFINMFTLQTRMVELNTAFYKIGVTKAYVQSISHTQVFPQESAINLDIDHGASLRRGAKYTVSGLELPVLKQETGNTSTDYGKDVNMYRYNTVYSKLSRELNFFVKPEGQPKCLLNDVRTFLSNVKQNGETVDSWTKFGINSYYDVDDYGPINKILNFKDSVFFFQDKGIGVFSINRAAVTTTDDGIPLELGTGEGFGKHQYISKIAGSIHQWGVRATEHGIYIFDAIHRKINVIQDSINPISEIKGIHSWLQKLPNDLFIRKEHGGDNPILRKGVTIGVDPINDEVIFTFLGTGSYVTLTENTFYPIGTIVFSPTSGLFYVVVTAFTSGDKLEMLPQLLLNSRVVNDGDNFRNDSIVFDEISQTFSSRYSATPTIWLANGDTLLSPDVRNPRKIFTHNIGKWGEFYGNVEETSITLIINPQADLNKILRTLEFNSVVRDDNGVIDRTVTITGFKIENEYQTTGVIPFSPARIQRRFDKWRVKIPRDQNSVNQRARFRSTYFKVTLYFDNTENKEIIMNRLLSFYDVQIF
jgi:hypothetical protein